MDRRDFLRMPGVACLAALHAARVPPTEGKVMTVLGPISPRNLGSSLPHEHVLVDFVGADKVTRDRYDAREAFEVVLPYLRGAREAGCRGFVECTPAYLGRDPRLLQRLAQASGLHVVTNTGYYGAAKDQFVPRHAHSETADQLADRWSAEWISGIEGTGIRPGFIKTGVDAGPLSDIDRKLVRAAARTHGRTGLTIASHTGDTRAAMEQLEVLAEEGVLPAAFIWVHAQSDWRLEPRVEAARKGAWIEIDNVAPGNVEECVGRLDELRRRGFVDRLLASHDAGWFKPGEPRGGSFRGFETVHRQLVPALRQAGWAAKEIDRLLVSNPAAAFTVRVRRTPVSTTRRGV